METKTGKQVAAGKTTHTPVMFSPKDFVAFILFSLCYKSVNKP